MPTNNPNQLTVSTAFHEPLAYGVYDDSETQRARELQSAGYRNQADLTDIRNRQTGSLNVLRDRLGDQRASGMRDKMLRENALRQAVTGMSGPVGGVNALASQQGMGQQVAAQGMAGRLTEQQAARQAYSRALGGYREGDIEFGIKGRELDQGWRKFQEELGGSAYDQKRKEMLARKAAGLRQAEMYRAYNKDLTTLTNKAQQEEQAYEDAKTGMLLEGGKAIVQGAAQTYGSDSTGDGSGGGGWFDQVSGKIK